MSRALSPRFLEQMGYAETAEVLTTLLTITAPGDPNVYRLCDNIDPVVSQGRTFEPYPFAIQLPEDDGETLPQARVAIDNVDRKLVQAIRSSTGPINCSIEICLASQPDFIELALPDFQIREITYTAMQITGTLQAEDLLNQVFPADTYHPQEFPGVF